MCRYRNGIFIVVFLILVPTITAFTGTFNELAKITASDGDEYDYFGGYVSISGDITMVGAIADDEYGSWSGSAYIFYRDQGGPNNWGQIKKLTASDAAANAHFGSPVSVSFDTAVAGAYGDDDNGSRSGAAYIFSRDHGGADNWGEVKKLTAFDGFASDYFGDSVSISGDTVIVGANGDDDNGSGSGSAYIFYRDQGGANNWGMIKKLTASDGAAYSYFGSVSISTDTIIVGAYCDETIGDYSGAAYLFYRNQGGVDNWGEVKKLIASDGAAGDELAYSVSISGDTAVVGSYGDDDNGSGSGAAYIFSRDHGGTDNWGEVKKLTASDGAAGDEFGMEVSISGNTVIVGTRDSSAYIFTRDQGGTNNWGEVEKLTPPDGAGAGFGESVSISDCTAIIGAYGDDDNGDYSGAAYILSPLVDEKGNIDGNCAVDLSDVIKALKVLSGTSPAGVRPDYITSGADVNENDKIGIEEVIHAMQVSAGLYSQPVSTITSAGQIWMDRNLGVSQLTTNPTD